MTKKNQVQKGNEWPVEWPENNKTTSQRGKKVATREAVANAVKEIVARGERPTIHRVMYELGGGSMTTISRLLKEIKPEITWEEAKKIASKRRVFAPGLTCTWFPYHRRIVIPFSENSGEIKPAREIRMWQELNPSLNSDEYDVAFRVAEKIAKLSQVQNQDDNEETSVLKLESLEKLPPEDLWQLVRHRQRKVTGRSGETLFFVHTHCPTYDFLLLGFVENGNEMTFIGEDSFRKMNARLVQNIYHREEMEATMERIRQIEKKLNLPYIKAQRKAVWFNSEVEDQIQKTLSVREIHNREICTGQVMMDAQVVTIAIVPTYGGWKPVETLFCSEEKVQEIFQVLNPGASLGLIDLARQLSCETAYWGQKIKFVSERKKVGISVDDACKILEGILLDEHAETQPKYDPRYFWAYFPVTVKGKTYRIPCIWNEETETVEDVWDQVMFYGAEDVVIAGLYRQYNPDGDLTQAMKVGSETILKASGFRVKPENFRFRPSRPKALFDWRS